MPRAPKATVKPEQMDLQLEQQLQESRALLQVSQMLATSVDMPGTLKAIVLAAVQVIQKANQAVIHLLDEDSHILQALAVAYPEFSNHSYTIQLKPGEGIAGIVIASGETLYIPDAPHDARFIKRDEKEILIRSLLVAPLKTSERCLGTLSVYSNDCQAFTPRDERLLTTLGSQAAVAIEKAQLLKTEREQRQLAEALRDLGGILNTTLNLDAIFDCFLDQINRVVPYDSANIMLVENGITHTARLAGYQQYGELVENIILNQRYEIASIPHLKYMFDTGKPVNIFDTTNDPRWQTLEGTEFIRSWVGAPMQAKGEVMGFFCLEKTEVGFYKPEHAQRLSAFAGQAGLVLQNAQLFESIQNRLFEASLLYQISQAIVESLDLDTMLYQVVDLLHNYYGLYHVRIYLLDSGTNELVLRQDSHLPGITKSTARRYQQGEGIVGHVAMTCHPFVTNNVSGVIFQDEDPLLPFNHAQLAVPLREGSRLFGVLDLHHKPGAKFDDHDLQFMVTVADQVAVAIQKSLLYADLQATLLQEQAARAQLVQSEKLAALGRIVASVAHELNNPLQAIQNALYLIRHEEKLSTQAVDDLQVALNESNRMADLIARLRETYRPATRDEYRRHSINGLVEEVHKLLGTHLRHNNITFEFDPAQNLPQIPIIRDQIKQVILNVSLNAVEAMPEGGLLHIRSFQQMDRRQIVLSISDTGAGIPPDVLPDIFDPFVTTKEGGTGLGLALSYDIVRRHNGQIEVENKPGKGATFKICLPLDRPT